MAMPRATCPLQVVADKGETGRFVFHFSAAWATGSD